LPSVFSLQAPRRFGGHEASARTTIEAARELAHGCGSTAWVSLLLSGTAFLAALLGDDRRLAEAALDATSEILKGGKAGRRTAMPGARRACGSPWPTPPR
jgi:alkylation response protein AidB-like acyl-CoA dehydrogenase